MAVLRVRFGRNLKSLRKKINLTQEQLAEKVGTSVDFIGMIERGERAPSFETIEQLVKALKIKVNGLFADEDKDR